MNHIILTLYNSLIVQSLRITDFISASISHKVNMFSLKLELKNIYIIFIDLITMYVVFFEMPLLEFLKCFI